MEPASLPSLGPTRPPQLQALYTCVRSLQSMRDPGSRPGSPNPRPGDGRGLYLLLQDWRGLRGGDTQVGRQTAGAAHSGGGTGQGWGARQEDNIRGRRQGWGHVWAHGEEWAPRGQTDVGRADACSRRTQDTQTHTLLAWMAGGAHSDRVGVEHPPQTPQQTWSHLPLSRLKHAHQFYSRHTGS